MEASRNRPRSISPTGNFCSSSISSSFSSPPPSFLTRTTSPNRVNLPGSFSNSSSPSWSSFGFPKSRRSRSISFSNQKQSNNTNNSHDNKTSSLRGQRKTCACSPTTHPGSFRCTLHKKKVNGGGSGRHHQQQQHKTVSYHSHGLDARRWAMTNSLMRSGTMEDDLVKRLAALVGPSSHGHQVNRRADFQPQPSRLSIMSKAEDFRESFVHAVYASGFFS